MNLWKAQIDSLTKQRTAPPPPKLPRVSEAARIRMAAKYSIVRAEREKEILSACRELGWCSALEISRHAKKFTGDHYRAIALSMVEEGRLQVSKKGKTNVFALWNEEK